MSKYIQIGVAAVAISDLQNLSVQDKFNVLNQMFNGSGIEQDNQGQIVLYTDMMKDEHGNVVPFAVNPSEDDGNEPDPYEPEEEEVHSNELFSESDDLPPTLRDPSIAPNSRAA